MNFKRLGIHEQLLNLMNGAPGKIFDFVDALIHCLA